MLSTLQFYRKVNKPAISLVLTGLLAGTDEDDKFPDGEYCLWGIGKPEEPDDLFYDYGVTYPISIKFTLSPINYDYSGSDDELYE